MDPLVIIPIQAGRDSRLSHLTLKYRTDMGGQPNYRMSDSWPMVWARHEREGVRQGQDGGEEGRRAMLSAEHEARSSHLFSGAVITGSPELLTRLSGFRV